MSVAEAKAWKFFVSWDNPVPADSSAMLNAFSALGKVTKLDTKTSIALTPKKSTTWRHVRRAIVQNLHTRKGNAFYVNLKSGKAFQVGRSTKKLWKQVR